MRYPKLFSCAKNLIKDDRGYYSGFGTDFLILMLGVAVAALFVMYSFKYSIAPTVTKYAEQIAEVKRQVAEETLTDIQNKQLFRPLFANNFNFSAVVGGDKIVSSVYPISPVEMGGSTIIGRINFDDGSSVDVLYPCGGADDCREAIRRFEQIVQSYQSSRSAYQQTNFGSAVVPAPVPIIMPTFR